MACGGVAGDPVAAGIAHSIPQPSRRPRHRAGAWPRISCWNRSWAAARVLARRHRVSRRRQSHVRRLSAGATLLDRDILDIVCFGAGHRGRPASGAGGSPDDDGVCVQRARSRVRPPGAGKAALGAALAAFLAIDRPEPAQCLVRMVDRSRSLAADDLVCDRAIGIRGRICARRLRAAGAS